MTKKVAIGTKACSVSTELSVSQAIQTILSVCCSIQTKKNVWHAVPFEYSFVAKGKLVKGTGVRIERVRFVPIPTTLYGKLMRTVKDAIEPAIVVHPMFEIQNHEPVHIGLRVGKRKFAEPKDSWWTLFYRGDLEQIFNVIKKGLSEDNPTPAEAS